MDAIDSIAAWMNYSLQRTEKELKKASNIQALINIFGFYKFPSFGKALQPFLSIISASTVINQAIGEVGTGGIGLILDALKNITEPFSRVLLLKILNSLFLTSSKKMEMVSFYRLYPTIQSLMDSGSGVLVTQMAEQLLQNFTRLNNRKRTI